MRARPPRPDAARVRKQPRQARAQATVDAIVEATGQVLVSTGYGGLTTNHVAERAGVSIGTLYQYFRNKDALIGALIDRELERHFQIVSPWLASLPSAPLEETVRRYVRATLDRHVDHGELVKALYAQADRVGHMELTRLWLARLEPIVEAGIRLRPELALPAPALTAGLLCRAVHHGIEMALDQRRALLSDPRFAEELACLICAFLTAPRRPADPP